MKDPYLDRLEQVLRAGARDLHDAADQLKLPYEVVCNSFNNGLLKKLWRIQVLKKSSSARA